MSDRYFIAVLFWHALVSGVLSCGRLRRQERAKVLFWVVVGGLEGMGGRGGEGIWIVRGGECGREGGLGCGVGVLSGEGSTVHLIVLAVQLLYQLCL
jgi:hypothetical protein